MKSEIKEFNPPQQVVRRSRRSLIEIRIRKGSINTKYVLLSQKEDSMYNFTIPGLNIFFSAPTPEIGRERAKNAIIFFYDYWLQDENFKKMILELNRLGFKANDHNITLKNLLNHKTNSAKFTSDVTADEKFTISERMELTV